ncbi:MAG: hypothetical protein R3E66_03660 [bacterium]
MSENDEMTDAEAAAFLKDLEARASGKGKAAAPVEADDDEDVEAFLKRLEAEESRAAKPVQTKTKDPLEDQFAALKEAPAANIVKVEESKDPKPNKDKAKEKSKDVKVVERSESQGLRRAGVVLKWTAIIVPTLAAFWLLGAFVAQWVSAGWLIALVAAVCTLALPAVLKLVTHKGRVSWWIAGVSLLSVVGLTAPMPQTTANVLTSYGHWPASTVAAAAGWSADHFTVRTSQWLADRIAGVLAPVTATGGKALGTDIPITPAAPVDPKPPVDGTPQVEPAPPSDTPAPAVPAVPTDPTTPAAPASPVKADAPAAPAVP